MFKSIYVKVSGTIIAFALITILIICGLFYYEYKNYQETIPANLIYYKYEISDDGNTYSYIPVKLSKFDKNDLIKKVVLTIVIIILIIPILTFLIVKIIDSGIKKNANLLDNSKILNEEINKVNADNKELSHDVSTINSYVNHELKNMINILNGLINHNELEKSSNYLKQMNQLVDDVNILTTSKKEVVNIDLLTVAASVVDEYLRLNYDITLNFSDDVFEVDGHEVWFRRMIANIIDNAFKYGANKVWVSLEVVHQSVVLTIGNNGDKIEQKYLDKIFNYKYQINELKQHGSGIGLSLVNTVIDNVSGNIYVESDESFTEFIMSFPKSNQH